MCYDDDGSMSSTYALCVMRRHDVYDDGARPRRVSLYDSPRGAPPVLTGKLHSYHKVYADFGLSHR